MKKTMITAASLATLLLTTLVGGGCTSVSKASTTELKWADGSGKSFTWTSPKNVKVTSLAVNPVTGQFDVKGLATSVDNEAVATAQVAHIADGNSLQDLMNLFKEVAAMAAKNQAASVTPTPSNLP